MTRLSQSFPLFFWYTRWVLKLFSVIIKGVHWNSLGTLLSYRKSLLSLPAIELTHNEFLTSLSIHCLSMWCIDFNHIFQPFWKVFHENSSRGKGVVGELVFQIFYWPYSCSYALQSHEKLRDHAKYFTDRCAWSQLYGACTWQARFWEDPCITALGRAPEINDSWILVRILSILSCSWKPPPSFPSSHALLDGESSNYDKLFPWDSCKKELNLLGIKVY